MLGTSAFNDAKGLRERPYLRSTLGLAKLKTRHHRSAVAISGGPVDVIIRRSFNGINSCGESTWPGSDAAVLYMENFNG